MEIYFADMLQIDHISGNTRKVQRVGSDSQLDSLKRFFRSMHRAWNKDGPRMESLQEFKHRKEFAMKDPHEQEAIKLAETFDQGTWCYRVISSKWFAFIINLAVLLNAIWIWIELDVRDEFKEKYLLVEFVPQFFLIVFVSEIVVRFFAYRSRSKCFRDRWFCFDATLVLTMMFELWFMVVVKLIASEDMKAKAGLGLSAVTILRVLRVLRIARTLRLLKSMREMMSIINGVARACKSMSITALLLLLFLYVFAVFFRTMVRNTGTSVEEDFFATVWDTMWTLLIRGVLMDEITDLVAGLRQDAWPLAIVLMVFVFLTCFTLLNMLVGIVITVITDVTDESEEQCAKKEVREELCSILECYGEDQELTRLQFYSLLENAELSDVLKNFKTDVHGMRGMIAAKLQDDDKVTFDEVIESVFRLRNSVTASVTDILELRDHVRNHMERIAQAMNGQPEVLSRSLSSRVPGVGLPCPVRSGVELGR
jgi:voltage-gated sodium channel